MKITSTLFLILVIFTPRAYCQNVVEIPIEKLKINYKEGDSIYINKINYFEYEKNNYIIDSLVVRGGMIKFDKKQNTQELLMITNKKEVPLTYLPLRQLREHYTSMFCGNFYAYHNYLLLEDEFNSNENQYLIDFQKKLSKKSFDRRLYKKGDYKNISIGKAKQLIDRQKSKFVEELKKNQLYFSDNFIDYIKTEIELGANNQFLNWYEVTNEHSIAQEFKATNSSEIHQELYDYFLNNKWNTNSIQYYRTIERIINYRESQIRREFKSYFEDIDNRKEKQKNLMEKTASNTV